MWWRGGILARDLTLVNCGDVPGDEGAPDSEHGPEPRWQNFLDLNGSLTDHVPLAMWGAVGEARGGVRRGAHVRVGDAADG